jgi:hypothetical protein
MTWYTVGTSDRTNRAILGICHLLRSKFKANESRQRVGCYEKYFSQANFSSFSLSLCTVVVPLYGRPSVRFYIMSLFSLFNMFFYSFENETPKTFFILSAKGP